MTNVSAQPSLKLDNITNLQMWLYLLYFSLKKVGVPVYLERWEGGNGCVIYPHTHCQPNQIKKRVMVLSIIPKVLLETNNLKEDSMTKQYCISLFTYTFEDMVSANIVSVLYTLAWMFHRVCERGVIWDSWPYSRCYRFISTVMEKL